jgi:hypothetical protein
LGQCQSCQSARVDTPLADEFAVDRWVAVPTSPVLVIDIDLLATGW